MGTTALIAIILVIAVLGVFFAYYLARLEYGKRFRQWMEMEQQKWEAEKDGLQAVAIRFHRGV